MKGFSLHIIILVMTVFILAGISTAQVLNAPSLVSPTSGALGQPVTISLTWNKVVGAVNYYLQLSTVNSFATTVFADSLISDTTEQIAGLRHDTLYYWRVKAKNTHPNQTSQWSSTWLFTTIPTYPSTFKVKTTIGFPTHGSPTDYHSTDYRLIGLPGECNALPGALFRGTQNVDWQIYTDNGAPTNGIVAYDESPAFKFSAGKAFWFLYRGAWSIDTSFVAATLDAGQNVIVPLHSGWNLITNPFSSLIRWSAIQSADTLTEPIWTYNGAFDTSSVFQPYVGYYFFNARNSSVLKIPYSSIYRSIQPAGALPSTNWSIQISAASNEENDHTAWLGVSQNINPQNPKVNYHKPRGLSSGPEVTFDRPEWDANYSSFATDIRPTFDRLEKWDFLVTSSVNEQVILKFQGISTVPGQFQVHIIDRNSGRVSDLRENAGYNYRSQSTSSKFTLVAGLESDMREYLNSVEVPRKFSLGKNYPNPFNPGTTIPFEIPLSAQISLRIFNLLGQEVRTLFQGYLEAGFHAFEWNGVDQNGRILPTGVYFYRLNSPTSGTVTRKMLMMK